MRRQRHRGRPLRVSSGLKLAVRLSLVGGDLYVANTDAVVSLSLRGRATSITAPGTKLVDCRPARSTITGRKTSSRARRLKPRDDGIEQQRRENGIEAKQGARDLGSGHKTGEHRVLASGFATERPRFRPGTGNFGRRQRTHELGRDLVPTTARRSPMGRSTAALSYFATTSMNASSRAPRPVASAVKPDYALARTAARSASRSPTAAPCTPFRDGASSGCTLVNRRRERLQGRLRAVFDRDAERRADRGADGSCPPMGMRWRPSASRSTAAVRCWLPTASAT